VPPLLSLLCAELNDQRAGPAEVIRSEQLGGRAEDILGRFYDRCLKKHPVAVRAFVEDRLLSADGFRVQTTWNGAMRELQENGLPEAVSEKILSDLVDDRLLVAEIRGRARRIELTHDILTGIARHSRDLRHEREAASKRRRARMRLLFIVFGAAMLISAISVPLAIWALRSKSRALDAKKEAEKARAQAIERQKDAEAAGSREQRMRYDVYKTSFQNAQEARRNGDAALWLGVAAKLCQDLKLDVIKDQFALIGNLSQATIRPWPSAPPVDFSQMYTIADGVVWALGGTAIYEGRQDDKKEWDFRQTMADQGNCDVLVPFDGKFLAVFSQKLRLLNPAERRLEPLPRAEDRPVQPALWVGDGKSFCYVQGEQVLRCNPGAGKIETVVRLEVPYGTKLWDFTTDDAFSVALFRASIGGERRLLVLDLHTGKILLNIACEASHSPRRSGHLVFIPSGDEVIVVDLHDLSKTWRLKISWPVNQIADASDSGFATTHSDGKLRRWSLNGELKETVPVTNRAGNFSVYHLSSGMWVSGAGQTSLINVVITKTDGEDRAIRGQKVTSSDFAKVVINPEHSLLAATDTEGGIYIWPLSASGEPGECILGPSLLGELTCFSFVSNNELILASGKEAASLQVSSTQPPVPQWRRKLTERQKFSVEYAVMLGDRLIAADADGTLLVVSQRGQGMVREITMPETIRSLCVAGALRDQLIVGGEAKLFVLRGEELALAQTVELKGAAGTNNTYFVRAATALDGDLIAIGGKNRVWIARLEDSSPFMVLRVPDYVWGIQYSSKNHQLLWHGVAAWGAINLPDFTTPPPSQAEVERLLGRTLSNGSEITPLKMFQVSPE